MTRLLAFLFAFLFAGTAFAADAPAGHPAIWKVQGKNCTVYLLGSVHLLSPDAKWRDGRIDEIVRAADVFYFETPLDSGPVTDFIAARGTLPPGQSLRAMLPPQSQAQLDEGLASLGLTEAAYDHRRPWLAQILMLGLQVRQAGLSATGVDMALSAEAQARGKPLRYFETTAQQMAILAPDDPKLELETFESFLKDFKDQIKDIAPMMAAWSAGDEKKMADLVAHDFDGHPALRKIYLDNRNAAWAPVLKDVLDKESGTFLVTVGAGHLVGAHGVPTLLRKAGYTVTAI